MSQHRFPDPPPAENRSTRFEPKDINATAVFLTGLGVLLVMWVAVVMIMPLFSYFKSERAIGPIVTELPARQPPEPRVQPNPREDLREFRAREEAELHNYAWVDRTKNTISIPIDRAIQLLGQRGVPASQPGGNQYYKPEAGTRETGFEGKVQPEPQ